jgi:uncharacterized damage-inducible protein DinB
MNQNPLVRMFEHNNWANQRMIETCSTLTDDQLDAQPQSATKGTIRETLIHLVRAQRNYLATLTLPLNQRPATEVAFAEMETVALSSGAGLLALVQAESGYAFDTPVQTRNGHMVQPWVILVQVINHATDHREQINSMLTALGNSPLDLDGWSYGEVTGALVKMDEG